MTVLFTGTNVFWVACGAFALGILVGCYVERKVRKYFFL